MANNELDKVLKEKLKKSNKSIKRIWAKDAKYNKGTKY